MADDSSEAAQTLSNHLRQKRARSQLSCILCRSGKLRCNRQSPCCDQCKKRNRESACAYLLPPSKQKPLQNVKGRIRQLESLVLELAAKQQGPQDASTGGNSSEDNGGVASELTLPSDNDRSSQGSYDMSHPEGQGRDVDCATIPFGAMKISKNGTSYVADSHWRAILNSISDLKKTLDDENDTSVESDEGWNGSQEAGGRYGIAPLKDLPGTTLDAPQPTVKAGMGFMLGNATAVTREQLIASVPEKAVTDRLLSLWFNSPDPFKVLVHAPSFQGEYRQFWRDSQRSPTMWLGLLFSILSIATSFGLRDVDSTSTGAQETFGKVNRYHTLSASAAALADFTKPNSHTIQLLMIYAAGLRSSDAFVNVWLMVGLVVRLALRMGYHRDASNYPGISTFDGEMRRRAWALITMIDVLISFQLGLPSMVKTIQADTLPPRNLLDRDFNASTKVLPPSRGIHEITPSSYLIAKLRLIRTFAEAAELSHATVAPAYDQMVRLDSQLEEAKSQIPPLLRMPDISELVTDPAEQLMCRFNLDLLYLKTKVVLHRRYMEKPFALLTPQEQLDGIGLSRKTCVDCGLRILKHHYTIYTASQPGGQLESVKWYMGSISVDTFLLAAMVICLELSQQLRDNPGASPNGILCPQRHALMDALEKSQNIWSEGSGRKHQPNQFVGRNEMIKGEHLFDETSKASRAMAVMIEKVKGASAKPGEVGGVLSRDNPTGYLQPVQPGRSFGGIVSFRDWGDISDVPQTVDLLGGSLSVPTLDSSDGLSQSNSSGPSPGQDLDPMDFIWDMLDVQGNLDWMQWDMQMNNSNDAPWTNAQLPELAVPIDGQTGNALLADGIGGFGVPASPASNIALPKSNESNAIDQSNGNGNVCLSFQELGAIDFDFDVGQMDDYGMGWPDQPSDGYAAGMIR